MSKILVFAVLLTCVICAMSETLDRWDNSFRTGDETESSVLLIALCLGVAFLLVRHFLAIARHGSGATAVCKARSLAQTRLFLIAFTAGTGVFGSPPVIALRI
jgi:hypothetical protein